MSSNPATLADDRSTQAGLIQSSNNGWAAGFGNVFNKELRDWFGTLRWLIQAILWIVIIGGFVGFVLFVVPEIERIGIEAARAQGQTIPPTPPTDYVAAGILTYFQMAGLAGAIGVIILSQDEMIGEKQSGTISWILSKPVSRNAIILAKLAANAIGVAIFVLLIPAVVSYAEVWIAAGNAPDLLHFLLGMLLPALTLLFYLCFSMFLGVIFKDRGPVLAILLGVLFGGSIISNFVDEITYALPIGLADYGGQIAVGQPLSTVTTWQLFTTGAWCIAFVVGALALFARQEV